MNRNIRFSENIQEAFERWVHENHRASWRAGRPRYESTASSATASNAQYTYLTTSATFDNPRTQWIDTGYRPDISRDGWYGNLAVDDLVDYVEDTGVRYWEWSFDPINMTYTARWEGKDNDFEPSEELDAFLASYKVI